MYIQWDPINGTHIGVPRNVPGDTGMWLRCVLPATPAVSTAQKLCWFKLEGIHEDYLHGYWEGSNDPMARPATLAEIKQYQEEFEYAPIDVFGVVVDCDPRSEKLMRDAIDTWDYRPTEPGWFEVTNGEKVLLWKLYDNTLHALTRSALTTFYDQMKINRAVRAQKLWAKAQVLKTTGCTIGVASDIRLWLS